MAESAREVLVISLISKRQLVAIMPEMDGYEFVRRLRQRPEPKRPFVIAMTANGDSSSEQASVAAGFDAYLAKPFVIDAIRRLMNDSRIKKSSGDFLDT